MHRAGVAVEGAFTCERGVGGLVDKVIAVDVAAVAAGDFEDGHELPAFGFAEVVAGDGVEGGDGVGHGAFAATAVAQAGTVGDLVGGLDEEAGGVGGVRVV